IVRVSQFLQVAAERGLRFFLFSPHHAVKAGISRSYPGVAAKEIHRAGAKAKHLSHPGIVVAVPGEMAIGAILRRSLAAGGVREMGIEGLPAVALGADGLLLGVHPFAIGVLRADNDSAR